MKKTAFIAYLSLALFFLSFSFCSAASLVDGLKCATPSGTTAGSGTTPAANCDLNDFLRVGINVVTIIYGVAGSLALAFFIYGGIMWLISGGNPDRVKKGTEIIKNAVIGLVIIFTSYMIINFILVKVEFKGSGSWSDPASSVYWAEQQPKK